MSRVAKNPVILGAATASIDAGIITIKGINGSLSQVIDKNVKVSIDSGLITFESLVAQAGPMSGTLRALIHNMVIGVTKGFEKKLTLIGVGYKAQAQGDKINLALGFSHPVVHSMPAGIKVETPTTTEILIKGADKQRVGQVAAEIRSYRPPEPYKGKGVRYADEVVVIKETKKK
ncbi:MAG: ribosomal protein [Pseudomonadota bacterium]|jgi:large subunit ribosomal protein L6